MIVLDTNVISALMRPDDFPVVLDWFKRQSEPLQLTTITLFEIRLGIALLPVGRRASGLMAAFAALVSEFGDKLKTRTTPFALRVIELTAPFVTIIKSKRSGLNS